jgi:hypothetical protein
MVTLDEFTSFSLGHGPEIEVGSSSLGRRRVTPRSREYFVFPLSLLQQFEIPAHV